MGQARQRGTFEQRLAMAKERDTIVRGMFVDNDVTARTVNHGVWLIPMTPERLKSLKERSQKMVPV